MKIIQEDNFNRDDVDDILIADNVSEYWAARIVMLLNEKYCRNSAAFHAAAVSDNYPLKRFEP